MTPITVKEPCKAGGEGLGLLTSWDSAYPMEYLQVLRFRCAPNFLFLPQGY